MTSRLTLLYLTNIYEWKCPTSNVYFHTTFITVDIPQSACGKRILKIGIVSPGIQGASARAHCRLLETMEKANNGVDHQAEVGIKI
jgi:hypothetical protein